MHRHPFQTEPCEVPDEPRVLLEVVGNTVFLGVLILSLLAAVVLIPVPR